MAHDLMDRILHATYHCDENGRFRLGRTARKRERRAYDVVQIRRLIRLLARYDEADRKRIGLARDGNRYVAGGATHRTATTYEDVFALCQQIDDWMHGLSDDSLTTPLLERLERSAGTIVEKAGRRARIVAIGQLARSAKLFIEAVVADALRATEPRGLDLLLELIGAPEFAQVNIVTLNHDTLVEQLLASTGIRVIDGFGDSDGDVRWYDDTSYDAAEARVKLIKLHGSINWYSFLRDGRESPAILLRGNASAAVNGTGRTLETFSSAPSFLTGGEKEAWYQRGIYADLHFRFHEALRHCDRMVTSGYGWGDTGITNQLLRWLDQRPRNRLLLLHPSPKEIAERSPLVQGAYDDLIERRQLIPIRSWLCNTSLGAIRAALG
jgi:SIR2-like protein